MTLTGSGMLLTLRHYIGFLSYAIDVLRYVALNVVNLRCLVVIHWSFQCAPSKTLIPLCSCAVSPVFDGHSMGNEKSQ